MHGAACTGSHVQLSDLENTSPFDAMRGLADHKATRPKLEAFVASLVGRSNYYQARKERAKKVPEPKIIEAQPCRD